MSVYKCVLLCASLKSRFQSQCVKNLHSVRLCWSVAGNWAVVDGPSKCRVFLVSRDSVWSCFQFAIGRWVAGWRRLQGSRQARAHIPSLQISFFSFLTLILRLLFFFWHLSPLLLSPILLLFPSFPFGCCVASHLLPSAALHIILSFIFSGFVTITCTLLHRKQSVLQRGLSGLCSCFASQATTGD